MDKNKILENWKSIIGKNEISGMNATYSNDMFPYILPVASRVFSKTLGLDLVSVQPLGGGTFGEEYERIKSEIKTENRDGKIDAIIENKEFVEKTMKDHPDYVEGKLPSGHLFYMDYKYGSTQSL